MIQVRKVLISALFLPLAAFAADQGLLNLVMPDAKVIAGIEVAKGSTSPFGQFVLSHMQPDDAGFQKFINSTNFDPRHDLTEIVMASSWQGQGNSGWLIVARGRFNASQIASAALANGGVKTNFQGVDILSGNSNAKTGAETVIAFLDPTTAAMGDPDSVKAGIVRYQNKSAADAGMQTKVLNVSSKYDFWFVTLVPLSEFAGLMPDANMGQAMKGNLFQAVQQASGGVTFGQNVQIAAECVTRSEKDAGALADVVRFIAGMVQLNKDKNATAAQASTLVDGMTLNTVGNVMSLSLSIPEAQLEQILESARAEKHTAKK